MRKKVNVFQNSFITSYIFTFIVLYFIFLVNLFIIPNNFELPIFLLIGFSLIIITIFYFFVNIKLTNGDNKLVIKFRVLSENSILIILMILMFLTFFIPSISFTETIMDWNQIEFLNYFRSIIFLIGCAFIPGACIFKILFPKSKLHERFKVESFLLKITIYPFLSFTFLGSITFILDQIGLLREYFVFVLFITIIFLFFSYLLIQKIRDNEHLKFKSTEIKISKYTFLLLIIALGVMIIALGIHLSSKYLIPGDSWRGVSSASLVGRVNIKPTDDTSIYTIFWGYISFSLSVLSGIPYININVMLFPFLYLFVTTLYLFMKAILHDFKEIYIVLSTILVVTFSELFYIINTNLTQAKYGFSSLIFDGILNFRFKSFAIFLVLISMALFVITAKTSKNLEEKKIFRTEKFSIILLASFFLVQSYMIYFLTAIAGLSLIFIYSLLSNNKKQDFKFFLIFWVIFAILFIFFDLISAYFFSWIPSTLFSNFLGTAVYVQAELYVTRRFLTGILTYSIIIGFFFFCFLIYKVFIKNLSECRNKEFLVIKINPITRFMLSLIIFPVFLVEEIFLNKSPNRFQKLKKQTHLKINLQSKIKSKVIFKFTLFIFSILLIIEIIFNILINIKVNFFLFYLDLFFVNIGFIGILGIYLSYFIFKKNRQLFYFLFLWGVFLYGLASIFIFKSWFQYPNYSPFEIPDEAYFHMTYWFDRIWHYSIIPLSIFSSIGIISIIKNLKSKKGLKIQKDHSRLIPSLISISIIIVLSLSNTIITGMYWSNRDNQFDYYIKDEDAQVIGWTSENIPPNSNILVDRPQLKPRLDDIAYSTTFYTWLEITEALDNYTGWKTSYSVDPNCNITNIEELGVHKNIFAINDYSSNGYAFSQIKFNSSQKNGFVEFYLRITDKSKIFWFDILSYEGNYGIQFSIVYEAFHFYNGTNYQKILDIESDIWYHCQIAFECSDENYLSLDQYHWKTIINGIEYGDFVFWNNVSEIGFIQFSSHATSFDYSIFFDAFNLSWARDLDNFEEEIINIFTLIIIDHLKAKNIQYYIISKDSEDFYRNKELIKFFKEKLFEYKNLAIYYANGT